MALKKKYYVVWIGHNPGIYDSWGVCQEQIKNYPGAKYKSFKTKAAAEEAYGDNFHDHYKTKSESKASPDISQFSDEIDMESISVDAACSGNPGLMEYRGVITKSGEELFRVGPLEHGTNNVGEFLALVHGLAYLKKINQPKRVIYSDSRIAIGWILKKHCNTKLKQIPKNRKLFLLIERGHTWLKENSLTNPIYKWETKVWGEIPADFGRK